MFAPGDLGPTIRITAFTLTSLSTLVVGVRCYIRICVCGKLKLYDHIMLAALVCAWGLCVINHYQLAFGFGTHSSPSETLDPMAPPPPEVWKATMDLMTQGATTWFAYRITYVVTLGLIKLSILVFYLSFATARTFRHLVIISIVIVLLFTVVTGFLNGFECPQDPSLTLTPKIFDATLAAKCLNRPVLYYCGAGFNVVSDAVILILPMPSLLQLRMHTLKRISLIAVFSIGFIVPIASAFRTWSLVVWQSDSSDVKYTSAYMFFWSQVEINIAILCASAPSLQPIFKYVFHRFVSSRTHASYYNYGDGPHTRMEESFERRSAGETSLTEIEGPDCVYHPTKPIRWSPKDTENEMAVLDQDRTSTSTLTREKRTANAIRNLHRPIHWKIRCTRRGRPSARKTF